MRTPEGDRQKQNVVLMADTVLPEPQRPWTLHDPDDLLLIEWLRRHTNLKAIIPVAGNASLERTTRSMKNFARRTGYTGEIVAPEDAADYLSGLALKEYTLVDSGPFEIFTSIPKKTIAEAGRVVI